jgi:hypothetical protein
LHAVSFSRSRISDSALAFGPRSLLFACALDFHFCQFAFNGCAAEFVAATVVEEGTTRYLYSLLLHCVFRSGY